jgi:hypothetical protein
MNPSSSENTLQLYVLGARWLVHAYATHWEVENIVDYAERYCAPIETYVHLCSLSVHLM